MRRPQRIPIACDNESQSGHVYFIMIISVMWGLMDLRTGSNKNAEDDDASQASYWDLRACGVKREQ